MEGGVEPTFECLGDVDHDKDFLHMTITIACTTQGKTNIFFKKILEDELVTNTTQTNIHGSDNDQQILDINAQLQPMNSKVWPSKIQTPYQGILIAKTHSGVQFCTKN